MPKDFKTSSYRRTYLKKYYAEHREQRIAVSLAYYYSNHEERKAKMREYRRLKKAQLELLRVDCNEYYKPV